MVNISSSPHYGPPPEPMPIGAAPVGSVCIVSLTHRIDLVDLVHRFIGIPYDVRHMDCADLAMLVQRELFGRRVTLPGKRPRMLGDDAQTHAIHAYTQQLADPVAEPQTGDAVLMREIGAERAGHIGTYFFINHTPYVLHTAAWMQAGSALHRRQDLSGYGLTVEGYHRWK